MGTLFEMTECAICMEPIEKGQSWLIDCQGMFSHGVEYHHQCALQWIEEKRMPTCPICRRSAGKELKKPPPPLPTRPFIWENYSDLTIQIFSEGLDEKEKQIEDCEKIIRMFRHQIEESGKEIRDLKKMCAHLQDKVESLEKQLERERADRIVERQRERMMERNPEPVLRRWPTINTLHPAQSYLPLTAKASDRKKKTGF